jgi:hypothetical protein
MEELREIERVHKNEELAEKARLEEKVLCAQVLLPTNMARHLGINSLTMKASELSEFVENEIENRDGNTIKFAIKFMMKTNRWIESLPEADI